MEEKVIVCPKCIKEFTEIPYSSPFQYRGIFHNFTIPEDNKCPKCKSNLEQTNLSMSELKTIYSVSHDNEFILAMIELKEKDVIEYQLKLSQFKTQIDQQKVVKQVQQSTQEEKLTCPKCGSTNITEGTKGFSLMTGFIGSGNFRYVCKKCGNKWKLDSMLETLQRANNKNW